MVLKTATLTPQDNLQPWNEYVSSHARGTFLELSAWADVKKQYGWEYEAVVVQKGERIVGGAILMRRSGGMGFSIDYVAYGPLWDGGEFEVLDNLLDAIEARSEGSVVLRLEPNIGRGQDELRNSESLGLVDEVTTKTTRVLKERGFRHANGTLQPEATLFLDTTLSEEDLLAGMRQTTRRYIRKAERLGVSVSIDTAGERLDEFYAMLQAVDTRKSFGIHEKAYYEKVWQSFAEAHVSSGVQPYLLFVTKDSVCVGAYFLVRVGNKSWELYGGVTEVGMRDKANYLLKWRSILLMKQEGVEVYDQWGVAPSAQEAGDAFAKEHPLAGVTYFKEGFGGRRVEYVGRWDKPYNLPAYWLARLFKKL